jgi:hypothetical protein
LLPRDAKTFTTNTQNAATNTAAAATSGQVGSV